MTSAEHVTNDEIDQSPPERTSEAQYFIAKHFGSRAITRASRTARGRATLFDIIGEEAAENFREAEVQRLDSIHDRRVQNSKIKNPFRGR